MPPSKVDVPVTLEVKVPPVSAMPPEEVSPPVERPPVKVEVPLPPTRIVEEACNSPPTWNELETVDEAEERKPDAAVNRSATRKVEAMEEEAFEVKPPTNNADPVKADVEEASSCWATVRLPPIVEEAVAIRPPDELSWKMVDEALFVTRSASPLWPVKSRSVSRFEVVDVAASVATDRVSGVEVPTERRSVSVVSRTTAPSSVQPPALVTVAHTGFAPAPWV